MVSCMGLIVVISCLFFVRYLDRHTIDSFGASACDFFQLGLGIA